MENILLSQKKKKSSLNLSSNLNKVNYDLSNKLDMISSRNNIRIKQADLIKLTKKITRYIDEVR